MSDPSLRQSLNLWEHTSTCAVCMHLHGRSTRHNALRITTFLCSELKISAGLDITGYSINPPILIQVCNSWSHSSLVCFGTAYSDIRLIKHSGSKLPDNFQVAVHAFSVGSNSTSKLASLIFTATALQIRGTSPKEYFICSIFLDRF